MARRFAVIPTNGRPCLKECVESIVSQVDDVIVIGGGPNFSPIVAITDEHTFFIRDEDLNISKWWNKGLEMAETIAGLSGRTRIPDNPNWGRWEGVDQWEVAILNDDTIVPDGWMTAVSSAMREENAAAACSGGTTIPHRVTHREPGPVGLITRMKGFAFIVAGEKGLRANEMLRWYFSDDHVDWMARRLGGMVIIPGYGVEHLYPNAQVTPEMHQIIAEDAQQFQAYWGMRPW